jgi:putative flavoprotein involved in K+ transport
LIAQGVDVVGRLVGVDGRRLQFSGSLAIYCAMADLKLNRLLERIDAWCTERRVGDVVAEPERFAATRVEAAPRLVLDLQKEPVATIVWATGLRPDGELGEHLVRGLRGRHVFGRCAAVQ